MTNTLMVGTASISLMANSKNPDQFKRLLHPETIIDARISFLTCEGETIEISVMEFFELNWKEICPESGELLEVE
ncbi:hypothetical protein V7157_25055 [Neobacillus drentensis]|uniref:hypothetical protein n=1 Tax=Neobacillus drentensis TaxID=220684 RepID=UPI003001CA58